ncbi:MAG TPA: FtsX-like permease family protein [Candidatus Thermoplasmatota archaeon]|nr:FtsX-like permease family protein [Candidatus Thermoplasmatota archaeon]
MILRRTLIAPLALLVAIVTTSVSLYVGIGEAPAAFFGDADDVLLLPAGELIPGQGAVDSRLVDALGEHESVRRVSAEIFAATVVRERALLVRGVDIARFLEFESAAITTGRAPEAPHEALAGRSLAQALRLRVGSELLVPGAKSHALLSVRIVGIVETSGPARDELVMTLDGARALVDLPPHAVHVIRIDPHDRGAAVALVRGAGAAFSYSNVSLSTEAPLPGQLVTLTAELTNWGLIDASHTATIRAGEEVLATRSFRVPARQSVPIEIPFRVPATGASNVTINPTIPLETRTPRLVIEAPQVGGVGVPLSIAVRERSGAPAGNVTVTTADESSTTNGEGVASVTPRASGLLQIVAYRAGVAEALADVFIAQPGHEGRAAPLVIAAAVPHTSGFVWAERSLLISVEAMNIGGAAGDLSVPVKVDGAVVANASFTLPPGARGRAIAELPPLEPGNHTIEVDGMRLRVHATISDPAIEAILQRYDAVARANTSGADVAGAQRAFVEQVTGNVRVAIFALSLATGALAAAAALAVIVREMDERASALGTLKALGASSEQARDIFARDALLISSAGATVGIALGVMVAMGIEASHMLHAFGHEIHPRYPWVGLTLIFLLAVLYVTLVVRVQVTTLYRRPADVLIRASP